MEAKGLVNSVVRQTCVGKSVTMAEAFMHQSF